MGGGTEKNGQNQLGGFPYGQGEVRSYLDGLKRRAIIVGGEI